MLCVCVRPLSSVELCEFSPDSVRNMSSATMKVAVAVPRAAQGSSTTAARAAPLRAVRSVASRGVALRQGPARRAAVRAPARRPLAVRAAAVEAEEVEIDGDEQRIQRAIQIRGGSGKVRPPNAAMPPGIIGYLQAVERDRKQTGRTEPYGIHVRVV